MAASLVRAELFSQSIQGKLIEAVGKTFGQGLDKNAISAEFFFESEIEELFEERYSFFDHLQFTFNIDTGTTEDPPIFGPNLIKHFSGDDQFIVMTGNFSGVIGRAVRMDSDSSSS